MESEIANAYRWFSSPREPEKVETLSRTRDIFQARLDRMYQDLIGHTVPDGDSALLTAVAGEVGNNCFDHNLGQWQDVAGCYFIFGIKGDVVWCVIADRGQGVLRSLKAVQPQLQNDQDALETAFTKRVSGRSPEQRGNGLKFVRSVVNGRSDRGLYFVAGNGKISFGGMAARAQHLVVKDNLNKAYGKGTFALILWKVSHEAVS